MAHSKFKCQVLTPEGEAFNDEVEMVSTRTGVGSLGILANHAPLMGMLEPTEQQQPLDEKRPDHRRAVFVVEVDGCSVGPTLLTSDRDIRLCVRPAWDSHALVPNACLPL